MEDQGRVVRRQRVRISLELIQQFITTGADSAAHERGARCVDGVPPSARLVHADVDGTAPLAPELVLVFEDDGWPPVPEQDIPLFEPRFKQYQRSSAPTAAQQEDT